MNFYINQSSPSSFFFFFFFFSFSTVPSAFGSESDSFLVLAVFSSFLVVEVPSGFDGAFLSSIFPVSFILLSTLFKKLLKAGRVLFTSKSTSKISSCGN
jgi:hypothetical protein